MTSLPDWTRAQLAEADRIIKQARAAALAGDYRRAEELRREFNRIFDTLTVEAAERARIIDGNETEEP